MDEVESLKALVEEAKRMSETGKDSLSIVRAIHKRVEPLLIRVCCDVQRPDTTSELSVGSAGSSRGRPFPYTIRDGFIRIGEYDGSDRFQWIRDRGCVIERIILTFERDEGYKKQLCAECNGAIIDAKTWELLAIHPRAFQTSINRATVNEYIARDLYDIVEASDLTTVKIYPWVHPERGSIWCISTNKGYDVSSVRWMSDKTYAQIIWDLITRLYDPDPNWVELVAEGDVDSDEFTTRLEFPGMTRDMQFVIGFRHHDFHPIRADPECILQIQTVQLDTGVVTYGTGGLPGIPHQETIDPEALGGDPLTFATLKSSLKNALKNSIDDIEADVDSPRFHYGYILRSKDPAVTQTHSDVFISSDLHSFVKRWIYREDVKREMRVYVDHTNRLYHRTLRAYLSNDLSRQKLPLLCPQFVELFGQYDATIENVVTEIWKRCVGARTTGSPEGSVNIISDFCFRYIKRVKPRLVNNSLNGGMKQTKGILMDFIRGPNNVFVFLAALHHVPEA